MGDRGQDENADAHEVVAIAHDAAGALTQAVRQMRRFLVVCALVVVLFIGSIAVTSGITTVKIWGAQGRSNTRGDKILKTVTSHNGKIDRLIYLACQLAQTDSPPLVLPSFCAKAKP